MRERLRLVVRGAVQGVGFRPFVFRLAAEARLDGWVLNSPQGVFVEVEGERPMLEHFRRRLVDEPPARAAIHGVEATWLDPAPYTGFEIRPSDTHGAPVALVLPDIALCADCRREILDPADRRHRYPFTNCTNCGPRFSLIESLPYDRANTSMRRFEMCPDCRREYEDPYDRRFHAQPNACSACGPQLALWDGSGAVVAERDDALRRAVAAIDAGRIVAVKGLGGFHLIVDATSDEAVTRLRARKHRDAKPLAVMVPQLADAEARCHVSDDERRLLTSPEAPIVLLDRRAAETDDVAASVAPGNPLLGVMLPYTPLHVLLMRDLGRPVVATSGNLSDEPICTDEREAVDRLRGIADVFLVHDRPIVRHVDDSVARVMLGRELVLRRARGYAPWPVPIGEPAPPIVAVGAHLKNTVAVTAGSNVFISQHIGDLESRPATAAFEEVIDSLERLYHVTPELVAADLHPDYLSTRYARRLGLPVTSVQHHYAHVCACLAENDLRGPALGVSWDGTGYGPDGTVWGGEFLTLTDDGYARAACLRPFRLPGGEAAAREPRRSALGLWWSMQAGDPSGLPDATAGAFTHVERALLARALAARVNAPLTTSAGRLFDALASLTGLAQRSAFEGAAAMAFEYACADAGDPYPFAVADRRRFASPDWQAPPRVVDWAPMVDAVLDDVAAGRGVADVAARVHATLAAMIVAVAECVGEPRVLLTGGCFQNRRLTELAVAGLRRAGFKPYWHQRVPPNDGGISLGQAVACLRERRTRWTDDVASKTAQPVVAGGNLTS